MPAPGAYFLLVATATTAALWPQHVAAQNTTTAGPKACVPYAQARPGYPPAWQIATTNVLNTPDFQQAYGKLDQSKIPKIPPKPAVAPRTGPLVLTQYNVAQDPDCWWSASTCKTPKWPGLTPDVYTCPEPMTFGLTYDDGPNCTNAYFYDFLKQNKQLASLFYIGSNVINWPNEAKRGVQDGHHIVVHTWSHPLMTTLTNQEVFAELYYTKKIIKEVLGVSAKHWRPPQGDVDDRVRAIAQQLGLTTILWNLDSNDWKMAPAGTLTPATIDGFFQTFINGAQNGTFARSGAIALEHEANEGTMGKGMEWYPKIKAAFKHVTSVATCMNWTQPYEEGDITHPSFSQYTAPGAPGAAQGQDSKGTNSGAVDGAGWGVGVVAAGVLGAVMGLW
ncbi:hypothetical protein HK104_004257 [Borealophlyctis nickersoniae]|nr:hypothetical protein HK104_004257 [Borealophlyctis nickersoniae]